MTLARTLSVALVGIEGRLVEVEANIGQGLPGTVIVGLPDAAVQQARDRVKAAVTNSGERWPDRKITIGLSPAHLPKRGSVFDLALATAVVAAAGAVPAELVGRCLFYGELGLDGRVRGVPGVLPAVLGAAQAGVTRVVVPRENAAEARLVPDVAVLAVGSLRELLCLLRGDPVPEGLPGGTEPEPVTQPGDRQLDLADVLGQARARRAVEVAAAGGHHMYMYGPPGCGKTMLAERLPSVLPDLDRQSALEVTAVHSVAGALPAGVALVERPPFQSVHHSATVAALVGGGSAVLRPGAASLAHRGVLLLDEAPEFASGVLEALRQPLESGVIAVARAAGVARYPARFTLVLAANPCPCAAGDKASDCSCPSAVKRRYQAKLSGPLLDRVDMQIEMGTLKRAEMNADRAYVETSAVVAERVMLARERTAHRLAGTPWRTNAEVPIGVLRRRWPIDRKATAVLDGKLDMGVLTPRGYDRCLRVAWTVADLEGHARPTAADVSHASYLRTGS
ncbi:MAG: YifB family Mg chelatase-like AAA ATPase [Actinomycetes bacterium]